MHLTVAEMVWFGWMSELLWQVGWFLELHGIVALLDELALPLGGHVHQELVEDIHRLLKQVNY